MDDLGRTLPTGAALHKSAAVFDPPASTMPNTPSSPRQDASNPRDGTDASPSESDARPSVPSGTGGPLTFGTTRREFSPAPIPVPSPKVSAREKAKRNILTHTLQMPLTVNPLPPTAASAATSNPSHSSQSAAAQSAAAVPSRRQTIKGTVPPGFAPNSVPPAGWTSINRVGSSSGPEPTPSRSPAFATEPQMHSSNAAHAEREDRSQRYERADRSERVARGDRNERNDYDANETSQRFSNESRGNAAARAAEGSRENSKVSWQDAAGQQLPSWYDRNRPLEYERETLPGSAPIRIPALSAREWLFIGLLACASAATLYSLLIDEVQAPTQDEYEAATSASPEHVVTPAPVAEAKAPDPDGLLKPAVPNAAAPAARANAAQPAAATPAPSASANLTAIISEPANAEIVVGGAVVGTTPAQVVRGDKPADYLLRKTGYESQLVRVSPNSPKSVTITLHPKQQ